MTLIHELLARSTSVSFEFFPPRTPAAAERLRATLRDLEPLAPAFVSVTYGAGGSTRDATRELVTHLVRETSLNPMAHLTAVSHTRAELEAILREHLTGGIQNLMLLRGDPPRDAEDAFWEIEHAIDLVRLAREIGGGRFSIGVAAHPEGHPASTDLGRDRDHLAAKLDAADFAVTQFFFDVKHYVELVEALAARGCHKPVVPGIMPVTDVRQIERFAQLSGAEFPADLAERLHAVDDPDAVRAIGVEVATALCRDLLDEGAPGLHFYTLNHSTATRQIHANLRL